MKFVRVVVGKGKIFFLHLSKRKKIVLILLLLAFLLTISYVFLKKDTKDYTIVQVKRSDITEIIDESGEITISAETDVYSPTNGIVTEIYVSNGDNIEKNQDLFQVESTATKQQQQEAYSAYLTAQSALDSAESQLLLLQANMFSKWDIFKKLAESDYYEDSNGNPKYDNRALPEFHIAEKEWLSAEAKFKDQQTVISQAKAQIQASWLLYQATQSTTVQSTTEGTVANLSVYLGDSVESTVLSSTGSSNKPALTIADYSVIGVSFLMGESDVNKIHPNDLVEIDVDPIQNRTYSGIISRVDQIGREVGGVVKYEAYVEILDRDKQLKPGMSADVAIQTETVSNVLSIPNASVKPYKGGKAVQVVSKSGDLEFIPISIGARDGIQTEVLSGLSEGQEVVVFEKKDTDSSKGLFGL